MKEPFYSRLPEVRIWKHFLPAFSTHVFFKQPNPHRVHDAVSSVLQHGVLPPSPPSPTCSTAVVPGACGASHQVARSVLSSPFLWPHIDLFFLLIFPHTE